MPRDYFLYLEDILNASHKIGRYLYETSFQEFVDDSMCRDAVLHNLDLISTSAEKIPMEIREHYSSIDWRKIEHFGDVIGHDYFGIDWELVWDVVSRKIPELKRSVAAILQKERERGYALGTK